MQYKLFNYFNKNTLPLMLTNFIQKKVIYNTINKEININFYDKINNEHVGYIYYFIETGQVNLFFLNKSYRNRTLGTQIIAQVINDIDAQYIWVITKRNDYFWSNIFNKSFLWCNRGELHNSVKNSGYKLEINKIKDFTPDIFSLKLFNYNCSNYNTILKH